VLEIQHGTILRNDTNKSGSCQKWQTFRSTGLRRLEIKTEKIEIFLFGEIDRFFDDPLFNVPFKRL